MRMVVEFMFKSPEPLEAQQVGATLQRFTEQENPYSARIPMWGLFLQLKAELGDI
jgi:hypothetical protein